MRKVFVNPAGQRDNLGDSVLRRPYLQSLRPLGELHVLVGSDADYASGLGLLPSDRTYASRREWLLSAVRAALAGRLCFAANAGEVVGSFSEAARSAWQPILALAARARKGEVVLAGVSVRPGTSSRLTHLGILARLARVATWRDEATRDEVGIGVVQPDWAFAIDRSATIEQRAPRTMLAVAMRGDRPYPADAWFDAVTSLAKRLDLEITVVEQVRRDALRASELAERLGARVIVWPSDIDHRGQEAVVRDHYRGCRAVISDRIHALIIGGTEGAVPIGVSTSNGEKIARTFSPVTKARVAPTAGQDDAERWNDLIADEHAVLGDLKAAQDAVAHVATTIASLRGHVQLVGSRD